MQLTDILDEPFRSSDYFRQALTHRSAGAHNNERLEYLGDALLGFFIAEWLFHRYTGHPEGDLTRLRAHLVRNDTLAEIAREWDLGRHMSLGPGELKSGGAQQSSILAVALEALIAAMYLSQGLEPARKLVMDLYSTRLERMPSVDELKDAKTKLQELLQSRGLDVPRYVLQEQVRKSGDELFTVECIVQGCREQFVVTGKSRRLAEQDAAQLALAYVSGQES
ncbi:MAG: ribonuclease III [Proteobacteria bacterium]|nr:ribonuclease III [Pseudomonadota bacterium]